MASVLHDNVEVDVDVTQPEGDVRVRTKLSQWGVSFTVEEDNLIVSGWLNISIDAIMETDQKSTQLWIRIHEYFNTYKKPNWPERSVALLTNRWSTIQKATNKFCGCLAQVESIHPSGTNEQDNIEKAKLMYRSTQKGNYNLDHCWNLLRHQPKWQVHMDNLPTKRKKGCSTVTATNATDVEVCESMSINLERPLGKKAEKEREIKRKRKESSHVDFDERFDARLSHMESDRKITMIERREAVSQADRDRTEIIELKKKMEMEIISMNVDNMNAVQREYFKSLQMEIIEKCRNELNQM
ncbi:hypothetical protein F2P56_037113 [Juglans regia]|uniref:Glutathione S-transferase T3-like n=2 Tax=Juglans regia TaxID=51240 RepID=A0A6P9EJS9_JUGRE|nr:glutathione S-transferase T3-like [Juglans regia]KAF5441947.1 hypothetical protein F2P56_037113 [Juglans regia]